MHSPICLHQGRFISPVGLRRRSATVQQQCTVQHARQRTGRLGSWRTGGSLPSGRTSSWQMMALSLRETVIYSITTASRRTGIIIPELSPPEMLRVACCMLCRDRWCVANVAGMGNAIPISARDLRPKSVGPPESKQAMPSPCAQNDATHPSMLKATAGGSKSGNPSPTLASALVGFRPHCRHCRTDRRAPTRPQARRAR
jgi:hypothetical protein